MCKKIFVGATAQHCGKTTVSLSLMHLASKKYSRIGFVKPIGPKCVEYKGVCMDIDAAMIASVFHLDEDSRLMSPMPLVSGSTRRFLDGEIPADYPRRVILEAVEQLEKKNDFLIIEGAGHSGVGSVFGVDNATVAAMLGAPVLLVSTDPRNGTTLQRPMMAQDTGGAIRGPLRFDFFWGFGNEAGQTAGRQKYDVSAWLLVPKGSTPESLLRR